MHLEMVMDLEMQLVFLQYLELFSIILVKKWKIFVMDCYNLRNKDFASKVSCFAIASIRSPYMRNLSTYRNFPEWRNSASFTCNNGKKRLYSHQSSRTTFLDRLSRKLVCLKKLSFNLHVRKARNIFEDSSSSSKSIA